MYGDAVSPLLDASSNPLSSLQSSGAGKKVSATLHQEKTQQQVRSAYEQLSWALLNKSPVQDDDSGDEVCSTPKSSTAK